MHDGSTSDRGWRGHVVLLFSDLCDYTMLGESLDPEEVDGLRRDLERLTVGVILKHGGSVSQVYGDGVLAVFGFPTPRENDARRAVEAALEMHAVVRAAQLDRQVSGGFEPRLHTGVHRGLVFVRDGDAVHGKYDLTGDAVNTTARLCALARRDELIVSGAVLSGIEGFFATDAGTEELLLKGKSTPVPAWRVTGRSGVQTQFEARSRRGVTKFIGRAHEHRELSAALLEARRGRGQLVAVMGPAGIGKTRLLEQLRAAPEAGPFVVLWGSCESYGEMAPLQPFLQLVRRFFSVKPESDLHTATLSVAGVLGALGCEVDPRLPDALAQLAVGARRPELPAVHSQARERSQYSLARPRARFDEPSPLSAEQALGQLLQAVGRRGPLLLILDDWQWADDASRAVLEGLLQGLDTQAACVVIALRPVELLDPLVGRARLLTLQPFDEEESAQAICALKPEAFDRAGLRALHRHAGGNPLFLEELCQSLPADVQVGESTLSRSAPPTTVQAAIQVRVAALPSREAHVLSVAAVIGIEFSRAHLAQLVSEESLQTSVDTLVRSDLIFAVEEDESVYRFKHGITREVMYESVRIADRRRIHGALLQLIEESLRVEQLDERQTEHAESLAYHARGSGDFERAAHFAELAGHKARASSALDRARFQFESALTALDRLAPSVALRQRWLAISTRWALACVYSPAREQLALLERALAYAYELGEVGAQAQTHDSIGWIYYVLGDYQHATRHYQAALAQAAGSAKLQAQLWANLGQTYAAAGDYEAALPLLSRSIDEKRARVRRADSAHAQGFAYSLACRASVYAHRGDFDSAGRDVAEARAAVGGSGIPVEGSVFALEAMVALYQGEFRACVEAAVRSREIAERVNSLYVYATATAYESYARFVLERKPESLRRLEQAVGLLERRESGLFLSFSYGCLAQGLLAAGAWEQAEDYANRALARAALGDTLGEAAAYRVLSETCARRGGPSQEVERLLAEALRAGHARGSALEQTRTQLLSVELPLRQGAAVSA